VFVCLKADDSHVRGEVTDEGIGIPSDELERIWDRFYQVDSTTTRQFGGTGLGLAIVKQLVEAHAGQVGVRSMVGEGSTFYFTVPRADTRAGTRAGDRERV
jgi:signal transduction histidine kinase